MLSIDSGSDPTLDEFFQHQTMLLPHTASYLGRTNLDVGCGSGITSVVHAERLGIRPTLCDVIDIRRPEARSLPFRLIAGADLPFLEDEFASSYLQYVLHHLPHRRDIERLLAEAARVSRTIVVVEEVKGDRTDVVRAKEFDREVNDRLHPGFGMPVFDYCSAADVASLLADAGAPVVFHAVASAGSPDNGFLETHIFAGGVPRSN